MLLAWVRLRMDIFNIQALMGIRPSMHVLYSKLYMYVYPISLQNVNMYLNPKNWYIY